MVYRVYVEKKPGFDVEAQALKRDFSDFLGIEGLTSLRLLNRYDVEGIDWALFEKCVRTVFSEPQTDEAAFDLPHGDATVFAVEYLPGQFDQRADSAAQCVQLASQQERPVVRTARVYLLTGALSEEAIGKIKKYVINPVESREASLAPVGTLQMPVDAPERVEVLSGFRDLDEGGRAALLKELSLAMDAADLKFCQDYFRGEHRDPTLTELRVIDTYWSDHCRHTTFLTHLTDVAFDDPDAKAAYQRYLAARKELGRDRKPVTLMDIATIGAQVLKAKGLLNDLDESEEINACTVKITVDVDGKPKPWLLLFKNETHNHPTEIEPFGGAATCIGGAIRDPLSGRGYVYQAMRVTGAADPTVPISQALPGKLPQRKLTTTAAAGYSSYGNQIGLATGLVDELYHPGYAAKRLEIGAVIGAAPASHVRRETPAPGDVVVLLGGRTGRDGCGGATGSSKAHDASSLEKCGAEVQKGNAPEERKLQRLFRDERAARLIKRCNDFGAGGVSVAIGELADGLKIDLNAVPKKYEGLDGTELAISESQERMAVVLSPEDVPEFMSLAVSENLEATVVAQVTGEKRMVMTWNGESVVDLSREFLSSNGASRSASAHVSAAQKPKTAPDGNFEARLIETVSSLNVCSKRGLSERFDATIGAGSVLMPFGGKRQRTPAQAMAALIPVLNGKTGTCSVMAWGGNPYEMETSPYRGAYKAVVESVARLVAAGGAPGSAHLTFQEYFERMTADERRWGKPLGALLGALDAQLDLGVAAVGGKDSMSGSFEQLDVPPTLVSFAVSTASAKNVISPEFKRAGARVRLIAPECRENGLPDPESLKAALGAVSGMIQKDEIVSAMVPGFGGIAAAVFKMCLGNRIGFKFAPEFDLGRAFDAPSGAFVVELAENAPELGEPLGETTAEYHLNGIPVEKLEDRYDGKLEKVFPSGRAGGEALEAYSFEAASRATPRVKIAKPRVLIPVFPGTNCEYDSARAFEAAGATARVFIVNNLSAEHVAQSASVFADEIVKSQIVFIPGGFSGGDEPDGSGKFITAFFRNPRIREKLMALLQARDGLVGGVCNGFQALVKLGLVPYGEIRDMRQDDPTLTFNTIGRHQSRLVRVRVASNQSPWLMLEEVGAVRMAPVSHGEGRFIIRPDQLKALAASGQIATQYCDEAGRPSMDIQVNPNGSMAAVEGITSPDGRVFGRMAHFERSGDFLYRNVPGDKISTMFRGAVDYYR
jgi:phosphoribosylformylglycinamidine synthase